MIAPESYSYRTDPSVPEFEGGEMFAVMDAHCALCAHGARWIARQDRAQAIKIVPLQSPLGEALMRHYGLSPADPTSWLFLDHGTAHHSLDALIIVGQRLGGIWRGLAAFKVLPRPVRTWLYRLVARNRYRLFGRGDLCNLPNPEVQRRLIKP